MRFIVAFLPALLLSSTIYAEESGEIDAHTKSRAQSLYNAIKHKEPKFSLSGPLQKGSGDLYKINGEEFSVATDALIQGELRVGSVVNVRGIITNNKKIAKKVHGTSDSQTLSIKKNSQALD